MEVHFNTVEVDESRFGAMRRDLEVQTM